MKKFFRVIAAVACMACMVTMTSGCTTMFFPKCDGVEISGTPIDNNLNNSLSGANLVRIGDKLYFNYVKNESTFGVVEISEEGAKPIVSREPFKLYLYPVDNYVVNYKDQLLIYRKLYPVQRYSFQTNQLEPFEEINGIPVGRGRFQQCGDLIVQAITESEGQGLWEEKGLCWYYNGKQGEVAHDKDIYTFCALEDCFYYVVEIKKSQYESPYHELYRFDCKTQKEELILQPEHPSYIQLWMCGDTLIISTKDKRKATSLLQKIDLRSNSHDIETIHTFEDNVTCCNAYDQLLYIRREDPSDRYTYSLETYNINTGECNILQKKVDDIYDCYIFDDTWMYLVCFDGSYPDALYRIKQDGTCFEKVYG